MEEGYESRQGTLTANKFAITDADSQFLYTPPSVKVNGAVARTYGQRMSIGLFSIQNRSGGTAIVGIGIHFAPWEWVAGQWVDLTTTYTDDTADAQSATASDFPMETTTASDGHIVAADRMFNIVGYQVGTASAGAGAAPVRALSYSVAGGTWSTVPTAYVNPVTGAHWATGERAVWFVEPRDWAPLESDHGTGVPVGRYGLRMRATTPPSGAGLVAALATELVVGRMYYTTESVANEGVVEPPSTMPITAIGAHIAFAVSRDTDTANVANTSGSRALVAVKLIG